MTEKEARERLNRFKTIKVLYGNTFAIHLEQLEQLQNDIETVLNLLEKKDKIIDEMANSFAEEGFYSEHCQTLIDNDICPDDCNKCVKQYFERKAKNE